MSKSTIEQLISTLDVSVEALAVCGVARGAQLVGQPDDAAIVHFVLSGTLYLNVPGAERLVCPTGTIVLVPPRVQQFISADPDPQRSVASHEVVSLGRDGMVLVNAADGGVGDLRFACGAVTSNLPRLVGMMANNGQALVGRLGDTPYFQTAFALMQEEIGAFGPGARALVSALMKSCMILMLREELKTRPQRTNGLDALHHPRVGRALNLVLNQPGRAHSVATLAATAGMSRSAFAKEFLEVCEITPMAFVTRSRLHHAVSLLKAGRMPVKAIAAAVGYSSRSHFSRAFRDAYGVDPTQFRKQLGAEG